MNQINHKFYFVIFFSFLFHIFASFYSTGWLNADEQSCILEYVNLKLGFNSHPCFLNYVDQKAIDSSIKLRSWAQPYFYYLIAKLLLSLKVTDFITITFFLKLFSSIIGWISIIFFYFVTKNDFKNKTVKNFYFYIIFLFWFYPILHARTSAENLSISFLLFGIAFYLYNRNNLKILNIFILGALFATSFVFRYNLIFCILFFYLWLFIFEDKNLKTKFKICFFSFLSGVFILLLELLINVWGFENTINFYNLLNINFIISNSPFFQFFFYFKGNNFYSGSDWSGHNFFSYIELILLKFYPPLSFLVLFSFFYLIFKNYKSLIVWIVFPYFLVHSYFSHKELRYIFPILAFSPYFICYFFDNFFIKKKLKYYLFNIILIFNFFGLLFVSVSSLRPELKVLNEIYNDEISNIFYVNYDNSIKFYESLNPFEIDNITHNYYFKFKNGETTINKTIKNEKIKIGSCKAFCLKEDFIIDYEKNSLSLNYIKDKDDNKNLEIKLINLSDNYNFDEFMTEYFSHNEIFILTQDHNTINKIKKNKNCKVLKKAKPIILSSIYINKINERIENLVYFSCKQ